MNEDKKILDAAVIAWFGSEERFLEVLEESTESLFQRAENLSSPVKPEYEAAKLEARSAILQELKRRGEI